MQLGMIGLGRMGANMVRRLICQGHHCVVFDLNPANVEELVKEGAVGASSLEDLVNKLSAPRAAWVMVPAGAPTQKTVETLAAHMQAGDTIIDGGNSFFKDDIARAAKLKPRGIHYVDVGTSGGIWGLKRGYCLMIGGPKEAVERLDPILRSLAPGRGDTPTTPGPKLAATTAEEGYLHCGPEGAGHFVKMVHNGIEYGLMQSYAEGFHIMEGAGGKEPCGGNGLAEANSYHFDLPAIAELWRRGSVVGSWLLDLSAIALRTNPSLSNFTGHVQDSGEGRWTIMAAIEEAVPSDVLTAALFTRFRSRQDHTYAEKMLSAMRHGFGGHVELPSGG